MQSNLTACSWLLQQPDNQQIQIKFIRFDLGGDCDKNYLKVYNGKTQTAPKIGTFCTNKPPSSIRSQGNYILLEYIREENPNGRGFNVTYEPAVDGCGGIFHDSIKSIESPGYPKNYPNNAECLWEIHVADGYTIQLKSDDRFHLEDSDNCVNDFLEVWDWIDDKWVSLGRKCGRQIPSFNSTTNKLKILFRSDNFTNFQGFKVTWTTNCGGVYKADQTKRYLVSPGYPEGYSNNLQCHYKIYTENQFLYVTFEDFMLERGKNINKKNNFYFLRIPTGSSGCKYDNLSVRPHAMHIYGQPVAYCGDNAPPNYKAYKTFEMTLKTDSSLSRRGFRVSYQAEKCGGQITTEGEIASSTSNATFSYILGNYPASNMYCLWNITAPPGKLIVLQ